MKIVYWAAGLLLLVAVLILGLQIAASERIEVVELHIKDASGEENTTRLWIVDDAGFAYLRTSNVNSGWAASALSAAEFELTRNGNRARLRAVPRPDKRDIVNSLMRSKYTWGDQVIEVLIGGRDESVPLELHSIN